MEELDLGNLNIKQVITHHIGNKHNGEEITYSQARGIIGDYSKEYFTEYFFNAIPLEEFYSFGSEEQRENNSVFRAIKNLFAQEDFVTNSKDMAYKLYESGDHPNIKAGLLHIVHMENVVINNESVQAIAIMKSVNAKPFLRFDHQGSHYSIEHELGHDLKSLDLACLVLDLESDEGPIAFSFAPNKADVSEYWKKDFLNLKVCQTEFHQTKAIMNLAKNYVELQLDEDFDVCKADKIDLLNRSASYFKENESFNRNEFEQKVFEDENVIDSFRNFDDSQTLERNNILQDQFDISTYAVKKQSKIFKSVLKLDKNFHIYIHGNRNLIEQGEDEESGKKYYKVYYDVER